MIELIEFAKGVVVVVLSFGLGFVMRREWVMYRNYRDGK